jgi:hypothetical protein
LFIRLFWFFKQEKFLLSVKILHTMKHMKTKIKSTFSLLKAVALNQEQFFCPPVPNPTHMAMSGDASDYCV